VRRRSALGVVAFGALASLLLAVPAGAAPGLGTVTVSNQSPARASEIEVSTTGWQPGGVVSILLTGTEGVIARAKADSTGAAHIRASIPADAAPGRDVLSVVGSTPAGFPQQITSVLAVPAPPKSPAPPRPWPAVFALLALAAITMLIGERWESAADRRARQLTTSERAMAGLGS
jgi:hypothetical protein